MFEFLTTKYCVLQNQHGITINQMRSGNDTKLKEAKVNSYCDGVGIKHEFSNIRTPQ